MSATMTMLEYLEAVEAISLRKRVKDSDFINIAHLLNAHDHISDIHPPTCNKKLYMFKYIEYNFKILNFKVIQSLCAFQFSLLHISKQNMHSNLSQCSFAKIKK